MLFTKLPLSFTFTPFLAVYLIEIMLQFSPPSLSAFLDQIFMPDLIVSKYSLSNGVYEYFKYVIVAKFIINNDWKI
jgi:hypothetical protein